MYPNINCKVQAIGARGRGVLNGSSKSVHDSLTKADLKDLAFSPACIRERRCQYGSTFPSQCCPELVVRTSCQVSEQWDQGRTQRLSEFRAPTAPDLHRMNMASSGTSLLFRNLTPIRLAGITLGRFHIRRLEGEACMPVPMPPASRCAHAIFIETG